jgi:hypothetical protein
MSTPRWALNFREVRAQVDWPAGSAEPGDDG